MLLPHYDSYSILFCSFQCPYHSEWTHGGRNGRLRRQFLRSLRIPSSRRKRVGNVLIFLPGWLGRCPSCEHRHLSLPCSGRRFKLQLLLALFLLQPKSIHFYFSNLRAWRSHFGPLWNRLATIRQEVSFICQPLVAVCFCGAKVMTWSLVFDASFCFQRGDKDFATCTVTFAGYSNMLAALFFLVACFHKTRRPEPTIVWMESPKIDVVEVPMGIVSDSDLLEVSDEKTFPFPIYK